MFVLVSIWRFCSYRSNDGQIDDFFSHHIFPTFPRKDTGGEFAAGGVQPFETLLGWEEEAFRETLCSKEKEKPMSFKPQAIGPVPEETARIARAAYPKGNIYMQLRDTLGTIYEDEQLVDLFPQRGQPAETPWRLAVVSVLQFREGLSDRQAADAVRGRLDWKYLLGLELSDPGFDHTVLVEFRQRLLSRKHDLLLFDLLLTRLREGGYLKGRGRQRSDSTHVLAKIRSLNRVEGVGETFRAALNSLAVAAPGWLEGQMQEEWVERYEHRVEDFRLPTGKQAREEYAVVIGQDGACLLNAIYAAEAPAWLAEIPAVETLRRMWVQQFYWEQGDLCWRDTNNVPAAGQHFRDPERTTPKAHDELGRLQSASHRGLCDDNPPDYPCRNHACPWPMMRPFTYP
jgi:transposase